MRCCMTTSRQKISRLPFSGDFTKRLMYWNCAKFTIRFLISEFARKTRGSQSVHTRKICCLLTFSSTRKTWLNSTLSLVNRTFYQTVNVRKISRSWLVFQLRKRQGQLGIHHHLTEGKYAVHVTLSSTWKTGLNSWFSFVNQKFYRGKPKKVRVSWSSIKLTGIRK